MMREVWSPGAPGEAHVGSWVVPTASLLGAGWFFALALILGLLIGQWVDDKTGLEPIFTLIGILLGLAVAAVGGYRMLLPFIRKVGYSDSEQG
ncbi:MAG: AtpZ/AtpI family protein [Tepidiformaceae bacterium]